jgi:hypothetical protein
MSGIQVGQDVHNPDAAKLKHTIYAVSENLCSRNSESHPELEFVSGLSDDDMPNGLGALFPSGGIWLWNALPILIVDSRYQGATGNAIERWYKNNYIARRINPNVSYLTFATGDGALDGGPIYRILHVAHNGEYNVYRPKDNTAFLGESFTGRQVADVIQRLFELHMAAA